MVDEDGHYSFAVLMNMQVVAELGLSEITVANHRRNVVWTMNTRSLPDLIGQ